MRRLLMVLSLLLVGCAGQKVLPKFPDVPMQLKEPCPEILLIDQNETKFSKVLETITINYGNYNICSAKNDAWLMWYNEQKSIYERIEKR